MNKIFTTVCALMFSAQFNLLSAQTTVMKVWQNESVTTYKTTDVDSITFETYSWSEKYPVTFSLKPAQTTTRAAAQTSSSDAAKINNEFIVWGEKAETDAATVDANIVFKNYRVQYVGDGGNSASNTNGWEYAGIAPYASKVVPTDGIQSIKYWDFGKTYTFTAVSALNSDVNTGKVKIMKNYTNASKTTHGYNIELAKGADASAIYVADRKEIKYDNAPVSPVEMQFRNIQSKIRFGFYETVPGYNVQITGVKYNNAQAASTTFGVDGDFVQVPTVDNEELTYAVTYGSDNKPIVTMDKTTSKTVAYQTFGNKIFNTNLGTGVHNPTYDLDANAYSAILPNTENETPMSFTVNYKLVSEDTGEMIQIEGRQVTVPATSCQWKPNFAYTYIFKVTDNSAGLFPIALDAVVVAEVTTGNQEISLQ